MKLHLVGTGFQDGRIENLAFISIIFTYKPITVATL
jgi:hypothetical protein